MVAFPVKMRVKPSVAVNNLDTEPPSGGSIPQNNALTGNYSTKFNTGLILQRTSGTYGVEQPVMLLLRNSTSYVSADAEL